MWALVAAACMAVFAAGCGDAADRAAVTLRVAHSNSTSHPVHLALLRFAERLDQLSAGSMRAVVYPGEQLGDERQAIELVQIGSVDLTKTSAAVMEAFAPAYGVFGVPFLFRDAAHERSVLEGPIGEEILARGERYRLRGLCYFAAGSRSFYTKRSPVLDPGALAGMKIRTQSSPTAIRMVESMGATPTPIAFGELYTALQQGVVDGAENNPPSYHLTRHYEVAPHYTLSEHTSVPDVLVVGLATWRRLSETERDWVSRAADDAAAYQRELWAEAERRAIEAVQEGGATVYRPDRDAFADRVADLRADLADGPLGDWLSRIERVGRP